jgi:hypothetical protein
MPEAQAADICRAVSAHKQPDAGAKKQNSGGRFLAPRIMFHKEQKEFLDLNQISR